MSLASLVACSSQDDDGGPEVGSLGPVGRGDLCAELGPAELAELAMGFQPVEVMPAHPGRDDACFAANPDAGLVVQVEVWSDHGDLQDDIVRFGSPAARTTTTAVTVTGLPGLTAAAEIDGRQDADLVVHVDDRVLVVLVQTFAAMAPDASPDEGVDLAKRVARGLLTTPESGPDHSGSGPREPPREEPPGS